MKKELLELKQETIFNNIPLLDYIFIITTRSKHDSGYMCMEIIGENDEGYKTKLASFSDVIEITNLFKINKFYSSISIDCPEYNVIRIFSIMNCKFKVIHYGISNFVIEVIETTKENK